MYKQTNTIEHCQCDWQGKGYKAMPITRRNPLPAPQQDAELQKLVCIKIQMQL